MSAKRKFGTDKRDLLTRQCRECEVRALCNGGCPKERIATSVDGEPGHNYLCAGLFHFFTHFRPAMEEMARLLNAGQPAPDVMAWVAAADARRGPQGPCSCRSGRQFDACYGGTQ